MVYRDKTIPITGEVVRFTLLKLISYFQPQPNKDNGLREEGTCSSSASICVCVREKKQQQLEDNSRSCTAVVLNVWAARMSQVVR